jgi:hypothetical protein
MMRPQWLARWLCRRLGHSCVTLERVADDLEPGYAVDVPIVCDRCFTLGTMTLQRVA